MDDPYLRPSEVPADLWEKIVKMGGRPPKIPSAITKRALAALGPDVPFPPAIRPPEEERALTLVGGMERLREALGDRFFRESVRALIWDIELREAAELRNQRKETVPA